MKDWDLLDESHGLTAGFGSFPCLFLENGYKSACRSFVRLLFASFALLGLWDLRSCLLCGIPLKRATPMPKGNRLENVGHSLNFEIAKVSPNDFKEVGLA